MASPRPLLDRSRRHSYTNTHTLLVRTLLTALDGAVGRRRVRGTPPLYLVSRRKVTLVQKEVECNYMYSTQCMRSQEY